MNDDDVERRRADDKRIDRLDVKVSNIARDVSAIRDMLIGEPEQSALGRQLLAQLAALDRRIDKLEVRVDPLEDWKTRMQGSWMIVPGAAVVLGIIATFFAVVKPLIDVVPR